MTYRRDKRTQIRRIARKVLNRIPLEPGEFRVYRVKAAEVAEGMYGSDVAKAIPVRRG